MTVAGRRSLEHPIEIDRVEGRDAAARLPRHAAGREREVPWLTSSEADQLTALRHEPCDRHEHQARTIDDRGFNRLGRCDGRQAVTHAVPAL